MKSLCCIILMLFALNTNLCAQAERETLYNGIVLPEIWPPDIDRKLSAVPMTIPYLDHPPKVIPIDVGRQLFVDNFLIEHTTLSRTYHRAQKYSGNPVFYAQTKYEIGNSPQTNVTYLGHGGVFFDPKHQHYKMFYTAGWRGGLALATSKDLIKWERPSLNLVDQNIILPAGAQMAGGDNSIWLDLNETDSTKRYKAMIERLVDGAWNLTYNKKSESPTHTLHTSADGRIWSQGIGTGFASDYSSFFYNPFRKVWSYSLKQNTPRGRARAYAESKDFLKGAKFEHKVFWMGADTLDLPDPQIKDRPQLYSLNAVAYESIMLGEFYIHLGPTNQIAEQGAYPKTTEIMLGYSRDGFHFDRPDRKPFIAASRKANSWERGYLHGTTGVVLVTKDLLWFPYTGYSGITPDGSKGMYNGASIGMATLRRDGFASMDAGKDGGTLNTKNLSFDGNYLFVNVDCPSGEMQVEILDEFNKVIKPFSRKNCEVIRTDQTLYQVKWNNKVDLSALKGKKVKFKFYLTNGKLYSFWVSKTLAGASNGYLGAGGSGYQDVVDTEGYK